MLEKFKKFLGSEEGFTLEVRVYIYMNVVSIFFSITAVISNFFLGLPIELNILIGWFSLASIYLFYRVRFQKKIKYSIILFALVFGILMLGSWFLNGGIKGSIPVYVMILTILMLFATDSKIHHWISISGGLFIIFLFGLEKIFPEKVIPYPSELERDIDFLIGIIIGTIGLGICATFFKKVYETDRKELETKIIEITRISKEAEEAKEMALTSAKARSSFLANMSHEIRTPLNGILGLTDLLLMEENLTPSHKQYASTIEASGKILLGIINDILDISKIDSDKLELESSPFSLKDFFEETKNISEVLLHKSSKVINFITSIDPDINFKVIGDKNRLSQSILNLLNNSIKFTEKGLIRYQISLIEKNSDTARVRLFIKDTGIGIKEENISKLFQPFAQEDTSITRKFGGTGLGLVITKKLITKMGGEILLQSKYGEGTEFTIEIPFSISNTDKMDTNSIERPIPLRTVIDRNIKILVAEDNPSNQFYFRRLFTKLGLEIKIASNGKIATELQEEHIFDFIFMDYHMPEMDGMNATKKIREKFNSDRTKIILITADILDTDIDKMKLVGIDDFVFKPVSLNSVQEVISKFQVKS
ncbi:MAG: ATP-binding protein [Leptospiraceae bacterium]|nr:ATP-binding protein [Leptospiraceae bacterium]